MTMMKIVSSYWIHVWMSVTMYSIHTSSLTWHAKILLQLFKRSFSLIFILMLRFKQVGVNMYTTWSCHWAPHDAQDVLFTYRFSEAVCSGGIPVMVTSSQVPPLQDLVPFETYGVLIRDEEIPGAETNWVAMGLRWEILGSQIDIFLDYTSKGLQFLDA